MKITENTTVTLDYTLKDGAGLLLEETRELGPVRYIHGREMMLPKLEEILAGKEAGESLTVCLSAEEAYGLRDEELVIRIPQGEFEDPDTLEIGEDIHVHDGSSGSIMTVVEKEGGMVTLDGNHPYAGKSVVFEIVITDVRETTQEDIDELEGGCDCGCHDGCGDDSCGHHH